MFDSGALLMEILADIGFAPRGRFMDFGCGNGRMIPFIAPLVDEYIGLDVMPDVLEFCREITFDIPNVRFEHLDALNPMYPGGHQDRVALPLADHSVDSAAALSVFSHLGTKSLAEWYLDEFARVLKPGGNAVVSWFLSPPNDLSSAEERTVYDASWVQAQLAERFDVGASTRGTTTSWNDQWFVALTA